MSCWLTVYNMPATDKIYILPHFWVDSMLLASFLIFLFNEIILVSSILCWTRFICLYRSLSVFMAQNSKKTLVANFKNFSAAKLKLPFTFELNKVETILASGNTENWLFPTPLKESWKAIQPLVEVHERQCFLGWIEGEKGVYERYNLVYELQMEQHCLINMH